MKLKIVREKRDNGSVVLTMTGEMTIYTVTKLKDILMKELASFSGMVMNLNGIDEADTAGFQLLLLLRREAGIAGKTFDIADPGNRIMALFSLYNEKI